MAGGRGAETGPRETGPHTQPAAKDSHDWSANAMREQAGAMRERATVMCADAVRMRRELQAVRDERAAGAPAEGVRQAAVEPRPACPYCGEPLDAEGQPCSKCDDEGWERAGTTWAEAQRVHAGAVLDRDQAETVRDAAEADWEGAQAAYRQAAVKRVAAESEHELAASAGEQAEIAWESAQTAWEQAQTAHHRREGAEADER